MTESRARARSTATEGSVVTPRAGTEIRSTPEPRPAVPNSARRSQDEMPSQDKGPAKDKARSLGSDAIQELRRDPVFIIASVLILFLIVMALFPGLFTDIDPRDGNLSLSRDPPRAAAWFGNDIQGRDVYARTIYGARASILVGILATLFVTLLGGAAGVLAGYFGRFVDSILSRIADIFFAIPLLLGAIIFLVSFPNDGGTSAIAAILKVTIALAVLGWPQVARIMRSSAIQVKEADYVRAARALGAGHTRIIRSHILPNGLAPVIVVATISLGIYIVAEATLSFLGIGLPPQVISWGGAISDAQNYIRQSPHMLLFPSAFLSVTVLAFIMLGEAVRSALDPKLR